MRQYIGRLGMGLVLFIFALLVVLVSSRSGRFPVRPNITITSNGVPRLGIFPVNQLTLMGAAHFQRNTVSVTIPNSADFSKVAVTLDAISRAGITSVVVQPQGNGANPFRPPRFAPDR